MARPWIDFISVNDLPIENLSTPIGDVRARILARGTTLNEGINSKVIGPGKTLVLEFDEGTALKEHSAPVHIRAYIWKGSVRLDNQLHGSGTYFEIQTGHRVPKITCESTARVFVSYDGSYELEQSPSIRSDYLAIHHLDADWRSPAVTDLPGGAARKPLCDIGSRGAGILGVLPEWSSPFYEWHTFSEEILILQGDMHTSFGTMREGDYLSHPGGEGTIHGPVFSKEGSLMLVLREGPVGNTFTPASQEDIAATRL
jgi:hypothetical protein